MSTSGNYVLIVRGVTALVFFSDLGHHGYSSILRNLPSHKDYSCALLTWETPVSTLDIVKFITTTAS